jgi:hypothetical protein
VLLLNTTDLATSSPDRAAVLLTRHASQTIRYAPIRASAMSPCLIRCDVYGCELMLPMQGGSKLLFRTGSRVLLGTALASHPASPAKPLDTLTSIELNAIQDRPQFPRPEGLYSARPPTWFARAPFSLCTSSCANSRVPFAGAFRA